MGLKGRGARLGFDVNQPSRVIRSLVYEHVFSWPTIKLCLAPRIPQDHYDSTEPNTEEAVQHAAANVSRRGENLSNFNARGLYWNMKLYGIEFRPLEEYFECIIIQVILFKIEWKKYFKF